MHHGQYSIIHEHTFGKLTFGTITLCKALGASLGGFFGSPPAQINISG